MNSPWRITLLGELRAEGGGRVITRFSTQKAAVLLAYLAYFLPRSHAREALIDLLWPEADPQAGRNSLSVALSSLRHQLEPPGVPAGSVILADRASVKLNPEAVTIDVAQFQAALQAAEGAGSRTEQREALAQAVALYRGELLPGAYEEWVLQERGWLAQRYFQALGQFLAHLEEVGDLPRAVEYAQQGVRADPLREEAHRELIRLLIAAGQWEAAQRQYRELERLLKEELGATPAASSRALLHAIGEQLKAGRAEEEAKPASARPLLTPSPPRPVVVPSAPPRGTVTFLLTDIEGSTALWDRTGEPFQAALASLHTLLRRLFQQHGGFEFKEMGDAFLVAFEHAGEAFACTVAGQRALAARPWPDGVDALRVRMALHTGDAEPREGDYHGLVVNCAQRVLVAGHGGQILCTEATAVLLRRSLEPGMRLVDLGVYRLRDVALPERLFQVEYPGMGQREFPPLKAEAGYASHLPLPFTRFVGREAEVTLLCKLLQAPEGRLVTLMGPGGSGKTRLALEVARRLVGEWQGAVWFVPLADLMDAHRLGETLREALRLPPSPNVEPLDQVVEALSRQPALLLLDNLEHLVDAAAPQVRMLLERVPTLTLLVTSRQRLNLAGEREFLVPPLPTPTPTQTPEQLLQCESVQLFVDRAQAVRPDFQVTVRNAAAVAGLCRRLEGIPLALELAAARAQVLTPAQMLGQIERRFELLVSRQRDLAERHRTLREALEWSYRLLAPPLQRFFARLSVFRGGLTLEAAEAVCEAGGAEGASWGPGPGLALDDLAQLRECSLVLAEEGGEEIRFRMLETLRDYAREQLTSEELADLERRHAAHYLALAEQAEPRLTGPEQGEWLERLEQEHENLNAALAWCLENKEAETGLRLGAALWRFWLVRGYLTEGRDRLIRLLALPGASARTAVRAKVLQSAGWLALAQGDYEASRAFWEDGLAISRELGDQRGIASSLTGLGNVAREQGDYGSARSLHEQSLTIWRALGDRESTGNLLNNLGTVACDQGDYATARVLHEESLAIRRELGDQMGIAGSLHGLGTIAREQGDYAAARALFEESLALKRELGNKRGIAFSLNNLGTVACDQGDYAAARALHEESLAIKRELGDKWGVASSLHNLGNVADAQGDLEAARALFAESLALKREIGNKRGIAFSLNNLGNVVYRQGDTETARALREDALAIGRELGDKRGIAMSVHNLGNLACDQGDYAAARALYAESLSLERELGNKQGMAESLEALAKVVGAQGQFERAARLFGAAAALREAIGAPLWPVDRAEHERDVAEVRAALGEDGFTAAWAAGRALPLEQAIAEALAEAE